MECIVCGATSPKPFWRCATCGRLNLRRWGWWAGLIFSPWVYLALIGFRKEILFLFGFSNDLFYVDRWIGIGVFYPLVGVPFIWFTKTGWMRKLGYSMAYVLLCYGLWVVMAVITVVFLVNFNGRG